ncbi:hypothetical protein KZ813_18195 [Sphingomonas sp. RHCKR7]|uniref:hypothetical protein n=1 Tax=Sphingomonas folli TaxID=2862497 RepID=UPI001CA57E0E|nr:hypothetical protein [Sphingomonas folli]MBW6528776.1 hypothetical protein [Sphingomonas folli]
MPILSGAPGTVALGEGDRAAALAALRAELRAAATDDDPLALAMVETALGAAELFLGEVLIARALVAALPARAGWQPLPARPVRHVEAPLAAMVDIDAEGTGWVRTAAPVEITFTAGRAGDWAGLPPALRHGAVLLAAYLFADRGGAAPLPAAVTALWRPHRRVRLVAEARA